MDIKIVVSFKEDTALIGFQKSDCDPVFHKVEGDLPVVLKSIPKLVKDALATWEQNPRYRKCETDLKPPAPPATAQRTAQQPARQATTEQPALL